MFISATRNNTSQHTKDVIHGYCHANCTNYIPLEIVELCMMYCFIADEFDATNTATNLSIQGSNNNIAECIKNDEYCSVFGTQIILSSYSSLKYHHWRFKIRCSEQINYSSESEEELDEKDGIFDKKWKLALGIIDNESYENVSNSFFTQYPDKGIAYIPHRAMITTHIAKTKWFGYFFGAIGYIDMYLDLNKKTLLFCIDQFNAGVAVRDINISRNYRMAVTLSSIKTSIELISYYAAPIWNDINNINNDNNFLMHINYAHSVPYCSKKTDHFKMAMSMTPNIYNVTADYVSSLIFGDLYVSAHKFVMDRNGICCGIDNICIIGDWFYGMDKFIKAHQMFNLLNDDMIIEYGLIFERARTYHKLREYSLAMPWYKKCIIASKKKGDTDTVALCFSNMALLYDYENTTKKTEIDNLDDAISRTIESLKYNPNDEDSLNNLGYFYLVKKEYKLSMEYLTKSMELNPNNTLINGNMGNLLYEMNKIDKAIPYLIKSLSITADLQHPEVGPRCLRNYANILFFKQNCQKSNQICNQLMNRKDFQKYPNKDQIYWLVSQNFEKLFDFKQSLKYALKAQNIRPKNKLYSNKVKQLRYANNKYKSNKSYNKKRKR